VWCLRLTLCLWQPTISLQAFTDSHGHLTYGVIKTTRTTLPVPPQTMARTYAASIIYNFLATAASRRTPPPPTPPDSDNWFADTIRTALTPKKTPKRAPSSPSRNTPVRMSGYGTPTATPRKGMATPSKKGMATPSR